MDEMQIASITSQQTQDELSETLELNKRLGEQMAHPNFEKEELEKLAKKRWADECNYDTKKYSSSEFQMLMMFEEFKFNACKRLGLNVDEFSIKFDVGREKGMASCNVTFVYS